MGGHKETWVVYRTNAGVPAPPPQQEARDYTEEIRR